jgi:hypothetical protein
MPRLDRVSGGRFVVAADGKELGAFAALLLAVPLLAVLLLAPLLLAVLLLVPPLLAVLLLAAPLLDCSGIGPAGSGLPDGVPVDGVNGDTVGRGGKTVLGLTLEGVVDPGVVPPLDAPAGGFRADGSEAGTGTKPPVLSETVPFGAFPLEALE